MTDKRQFQRVALNVPGKLAHNDSEIDVIVDAGLNLNLKTELQESCCRACVQLHFQRGD